MFYELNLASPSSCPCKGGYTCSTTGLRYESYYDLSNLYKYSILAGQLNTWELCNDRIEGWSHSPTAHITPAAIQAKTPMSSTVAVKRKCLEDFSANDNLVTFWFFIAMNNVHWTLQPTCSHLGPAVRTLHIYGARAKHPTKKQVTLWRIILNTWEQHTDAGPVQGLEAGQAVEACTAAVEIFFKLLFFPSSCVPLSLFFSRP